MNVEAVATPLLLVVAVVVTVLLAKRPEAPVDGAVNVTVAPETGLLEESRTVAANVVTKLVLTVVLCGEPAVTVMLLAAPAVFVSEKLAGVPTPLTVAATL